MAKLASNNNKALGPWTSVPFLPKLGFHDSHGDVWYYPLITPTSRLTWGGYVYSYDRSVGDTFGIGLSNTKYVVPNKRVSAVNYDIPAGTYSPSTFKSLIDNYISPNNGSRRVANSFIVTVNGHSVAVTENITIYNMSNASSGSRTLSYGVNFSGRYMEAGSAFSSYTASSFSNNVYITQSKGISYFDHYMYYNIKIETGIKFK